MQLVSQEVGAGRAAMPIVNGEEGAAGPVLDLFKLGLDDVENNGYAIFVIVPNDTLVRVGRVAADHAVLLAGEFSRVVRLDESFDLLLLHLHVLLLLLHRHNEPSICCQLVLTL
jgi:hypothetical protein